MATRLERTIAAPAAAVYDALTSREDVEQWMVPDGMTSVVHAFEPTEGGAFRISLTYDDPSNRGKTTAATDTFHGRFVRLIPGREVMQEIEFETEDPTMKGVMVVSYSLREEAGATRVTGQHQQLPAGLSPEDNELGWRISMDKLAQLVEARVSG